MQPSNGTWRRVMAVIALLVVAAGLRPAVIGMRWQHLWQDPDAYRLIAENLRSCGSYSRSQQEEPTVPTAFRPPLYPLLLATFAWHGQVTPQVVATLHVVLGTLSVLLAWILARQWQLGHYSYLVALMVACDPILLNQSAEVMTETLATFMALAGLLALTHLGNTRSWQASLAAGGMLGLAALCRPTFLVWTALAVLWLSVAWRPPFGSPNPGGPDPGRPSSGARWTGMRHSALLLAGFGVVLAPWGIRNQLVMGQPILTTTHGGYTLLLGNNVRFYRHLRTKAWGSVWDAQELLPLLARSERPNSQLRATHRSDRDAKRAVAEHPEITADRRLYELAHETIRQEPTMFAYASLIRVLRFWTPLPHRIDEDESPKQTLARWGVACWYIGVFAVSLFGAWCLRRQLLTPPWLWGLLCVLALMVVHTVYWSNMRMRAPAMPIVYLAFANGCARLYERVSGRQSRG